MTKGEKRGQFTSNFGFLMAAVGSAVGLGNLWGFPYKMGQGGGFGFLLIYLIFTFTVGFTVMISEMSIGRHAKMDAVGSYTKIDKSAKIIGIFAVLAPFLILTFYSLLGGWVTKYAFTYILEFVGQGFRGTSGTEYFVNFITQPFEPVIWLAVFVAITALIVLGGVEKGIEKYSKLMMPLLFVMLIIIIIRSVTLEGAVKGLEYMFKPNFAIFKSFSAFMEVAPIALAQMFFSLSLGMGIMITYGSYLPKDQNIEKSAVIVPVLDTLIAVLAGCAIMPAVFAFGIEPGAGPGLIFITLKEVFAQMPFGNTFGFLFFTLVFFAALTSSISLLEVVCAYFIDSRKMSRKKVTLFVALAIFAFGIPVSLSQGALSHIRPFLGMDILDTVDFIAEYTIMPLGAFLMCIFIAYKWKPKFITGEIESSGLQHKSKKYYAFMIRFITPLFVGVILYYSSIDPIIQYFFKK